jgi:protein-S-isoprenylcysteine O-methyltransferase Ste14
MTRLPSLGPRGEGWVAIQGILLAATAVAGQFGPSWADGTRVATSIGGAVLIAGGVMLAIKGTRDLRGALTPLPYPRADAELVETGVYALVRHPIYGGLVLMATGWSLLTASPAALVASALLLGFFELKSRREEAWLEQRFTGYAAYRARTRRLIPWIG